MLPPEKRNHLRNSHPETMSLAVKVFWVEDQESFFEPAAALFGRRFPEKFMLEFPRPHRFGSYGEASARIKSGLKGYDMALIDYRLGGNEETGAALVEQLRKGNPPVYTEVIFYSGTTEDAERDLIQKGLGLSGVYLVGRGGGVQEFVDEKCLPVMEAIFAKNLDLTRMRGIMMAEMSDIEHELLGKRIMSQSGFQRIDGREFMEVVKSKLAASNADHAKTIARIVPASGQSARDLLTDNEVFDKVVSQRVMLHFAKGFTDRKTMKRVKDALGRVRKIRIALAHTTEAKLREQYQDTSPDAFLNIRRKILECRKILEEAFPDSSGTE